RRGAFVRYHYSSKGPRSIGSHWPATSSPLRVAYTGTQSRGAALNIILGLGQMILIGNSSSLSRGFVLLSSDWILICDSLFDVADFSNDGIRLQEIYIVSKSAINNGDPTLSIGCSAMWPI